jgi:cell division protein FtsI/penicillin-binding protein 2
VENIKLPQVHTYPWKVWKLGILFLFILLFGCGRSPSITATLVPSPLPSPLPTAGITTISTPDTEAAARAYLNAWKQEDYPAMYAMLTQVSKDAISEDTFTQKYHSVASEAALSKGIDYQILSKLTTPKSAQVNYRVVLHSILVGDIQRDTVMNLSLENGHWRIQWDDALILPELSGGNHLSMDYKIPSRANIYDRNGHALVAQQDAVAIGFNTGEINQNQQDELLTLITRMTNGRIRPETLGPQVDNYRNHGGWYLPVTDIAADELAPYEARLSGFAGVILQPFRTRYYVDDIAPHVVGYMSAIQKDEVEEMARLGYKWNERIGRDGLELWGEKYLAGKRGGTLYVMDPSGKTVTVLADSSTEPSQAIYTTLERDLQLGAQQALNGFIGAIVVLNKNTGEVLAMASSPSFNPNLFEPTNYNSQLLIGNLYGEDRPLYNRATQGQYPLGSVFKIVTMAAALKSGIYTPDTTYNCGYHFDELVNVTLNDWTYDHFQKDGKTQPSGLLTLPQGLMRSCNPFFWHIGLDLFSRGMTTAISDMARGFGLSKPTGIEISEETGNIPVPASPLDSTNNAIGQGATLVTPLQVADFVAAVGNGGTLYKPTVVEKIVPPDGQPTYVFTPTISSHLPISNTDLTTIQDAMVSVIKDPHGTAHQVFPNFPYAVAGKTGTAQDPPRDPHAWFVGYTFVNRPDKPDIAVAVVLENQGEGSDWAAPIFRGIVQLYFSGQRSTFPWETQPGVWKTPTPSVTDTPSPQDTATP